MASVPYAKNSCMAIFFKGNQMRQETASKILIVDDDPALLQAMVRILEKAGYCVTPAATGSEGLRLASETLPDLMIVDVMLPDIDGPEVCRQVKTNPALSAIDTILISSIRTSPEEQAEGLMAGVCEYIARPMANQEFLARVQARLRDKQSKDALRRASVIAQQATERQARGLLQAVENLQAALDAEEIARLDRLSLEGELHAIFAHAPICLFLADGEARINKTNPNLAVLFGGKSEDIPGRHCGTVLRCRHRNDHDLGCGFGQHCSTCEIRSIIVDTYNTGVGRLQVEVPVTISQNGEMVERQLRISTNQIQVAGEKQVLVCLDDITKQKQLEKNLEYKRRRLKQILESFPHALYIVETDYTIEYLNLAMERTFGAFQGQKCFEYLLHRSSPCPWCKNIEVFSGRTIRWEKRLTNNRIYEIIDLPLENIDGSISKLSVLEDVTEKKDRENALRQSEEKNRFFADLLQSASQPFTAGYASGQVRFVNAAACKTLGYSESELLSMNWQKELTPPEWQDLSTRMLKELAATGTPVTYEKEYLHKDGHRIPISIMAHVRRSGGGEPDLFYSFVTDLTDRKRMEQEAKELNEQLFQAQKMESIGRLAGGVAHDFNNMLNVILGYAEMALEDIDLESPLAYPLQQIADAAQRSSAITRQLLAFARKQTIAPQVLDLNATISGMLKMLQRLIGEDIVLDWFPGDDLRPVNMDPSQVDQLLANLCVNARDAVSGGGRITIRSAMAERAPLLSPPQGDATAGQYVLLSISDNGQGMTKETRAKIFEPFFTTKKSGQGTGLGLATVFGIVKQNKGVVNVTSEPGQGATFDIFLPAHTEEKQGIAIQENAKKNPSGQGETVLLVEDDESILRMTNTFLKRLGYKVFFADNPASAIRLFEEEKEVIQLLITDVIMPGMNGKELANYLMSKQPSLKCLFLSGYTADIIGPHGILEEGIHFVQKPFTMDTLAIKIREALTSAI